MIFSGLFKKSNMAVLEEKRTFVARNLLRREAKIGGTVFGPIPKGTRREFFCLDPNTWIWHEEWNDKNGQRRVRTTRYDVRPNAILKAQDGGGYHLVSQEEADHLVAAAEAYEKRIKQEYAQIL